MQKKHFPKARFRQSHYARISDMPLNPLIPGLWLLRLYDMTPTNSISSKFEPDGEDELYEDSLRGIIHLKNGKLFSSLLSGHSMIGGAPYEYHSR